MPERDLPGERNAGPATSDRDESDEPTDDTIAVEDAGSLAEPPIEADPAEETEEYLIEVAESSVTDPVAAGDEIGSLVAIAREHEGTHRENASLILEHIGDVRPAEFEVWTDALLDLAESADEDLAFLGLRSLAQLAAENPDAAKPGLNPALAALETSETRLRRTAIALVSEIGSTDPSAVRGADGSIATALRDEEPAVRVAGAIAAGRLLAADPSSFPRAASGLFDVVDDENERVRQFALVALANFAVEHPEAVPEKERAIDALANATDAELGLREGATSEALSALLEFATVA